MTLVLRAADRFHTMGDGIESWHCFSAGSHYDPDNIAFGALVGVDEHVVAPGHGFDWHSHRGVVIISWILAGALRHEQHGQAPRIVRPGEVLVQITGNGIRHRETNGAREALRFVQTTIATDERTPSTRVHAEPVDVAAGRFVVAADATSVDAPIWHGWVAAGQWRIGTDEVGPGDSVRGGGPVRAEGGGQLLLWSQTTQP